MKRHLFLMLTAVASMATVSCDNEDLLGVENHNAYVTNFERMFGAVNPEHDFKTVRTVSIDATFAPSMKSANLSVYDGLPSNGTATSLVGKFEHIDQPSATFKVDVSKEASTLYYVLDDGKTSKLYTSPLPQEGGKVTAKFTDAPTASYPDAIKGLFDIHFSGIPFYIDRTQWEVVSVSSEHADHTATMAFDNDTDTYWHTDYPERPDFPHTLVVDMKDTYQVTHFTYLARQDEQKNGMVVDYEVYVSTDGEDWGNPVLIGQFGDTKDQQVAELPNSKAGRYLKFVTFSEINGGLRTSASEIGIYASADLSSTGGQTTEKYAWFSYDFFMKAPEVLNTYLNLFEDAVNHSASATDFTFIANDVTGDVTLYPMFCNERLEDEVGYYILDQEGNKVSEGVLIHNSNVDIAECMKVATADGSQIIRDWNHWAPKFFELESYQSVLSKPFVIHAGVGNRVGLYVKNEKDSGLNGQKFYSQSSLNPDHIPTCIYSPFVHTVTTYGATTSTTVQTTFGLVGLEDKVYGDPQWIDLDMNDIMFYTENLVSYETQLDRRNSVTVAVEDLGTTDDFDFNDIVLTFDYTTGSTTATVSIQALGGSLPVYLYQSDGRGGSFPLLGGRELHAVMGYNNPNTFINTGYAKDNTGIHVVDGVAPYPFDIEVPEDFTVGEDGLPFYFVVEGSEGQIRINPNTEMGRTPQVLVISKYYYPDSALPSLAEKPLHWAWPKERVNINQAYTKIADWVANPNDLRFLTEGVMESNLYK